jgi:hypothetical protein
LRRKPPAKPDEGKLRRWGGVIVKGLGAVTTSAFGGSAARYIVDLTWQSERKLCEHFERIA